MSVRDAVQTTEVAAAQVPAQLTPAQMVRRAIETQAEAFREVLPRVADPDRFARLVLNAIKASPQLMDCFATQQGKTSLLLATMQAASLGLEPNTPTQDCWILPRKEKGVQEAQLSIGYRGYMRLARRSGTIKTIFAETVHRADTFDWYRGLEADHLEHRPADGDRGQLTHAYAVARFTDGGYAFIVLDETEVHKHRAKSDSWRNERARPYSPWTQWTEAMWRKTAIRALMPYLDLSPEAVSAFSAAEAADEARRVELHRGSTDVLELVASVPEPIDAPSDEVPAGDADDEPVGGLPAPPEGVDAETGETTASRFPSDGPPEGEEPMTDQQSKALHHLLRARHNATGPNRFPVLTESLGRTITTTKQVSKTEASELIDMWNAEANEELSTPEGQPF